MANNPFIEQVRLLVSLLPRVAKQECFALKGGTAINMFLRDMPRLSVDIDLAYGLPHGSQSAHGGTAGAPVPGHSTGIQI